MPVAALTAERAGRAAPCIVAVAVVRGAVADAGSVIARRPQTWCLVAQRCSKQTACVPSKLANVGRHRRAVRVEAASLARYAGVRAVRRAEKRAAPPCKPRPARSHRPLQVGTAQRAERAACAKPFDQARYADRAPSVGLLVRRRSVSVASVAGRAKTGGRALVVRDVEPRAYL